MIVVDANLLIYAYDPKSPFHEQTRAWLESVFDSGELIGVPWQNIVAFLRVLTHPAVSAGRYLPEQPLEIVDEWLRMPQVRALNGGELHWAIFRKLLQEGDARGKLANDAALAAIAIEHGGVLHSADRDFARFPGLRWTNPLATV